MRGATRNDHRLIRDSGCQTEARCGLHWSRSWPAMVKVASALCRYKTRLGCDYSVKPSVFHPLAADRERRKWSKDDGRRDAVSCGASCGTRDIGCIGA
jgi:hypothetical protein